MSHSSGSARRRRRRVRALEKTIYSFSARSVEGGGVIDVAASALKAIVGLAGHALHEKMEISGDGLACLLDLVHSEIKAGRDIQANMELPD